MIDSRRIANGDSDITLQARGGSRRGLSPSVPIRLDNGALPSTISGLPEGFRIESMSGGYYYGTNFAVIDSHRVLVTEKSGLVFLVVDGVYHRSQPLLNISSMVEDAWDLGLVGLALDPDFATNGWFYLAYTGVETASGIPTPIAQTRMQHVVRYTLSGGAVNPSSRHEILGQVNPTTCWGSEAQWLTNGCLPIRGGTHSVDDLAFDAGGNLLISVGDGLFTVPDRALLIKAQDPDYLMGKILRVNKVTGQGLPDNPFWTGTANDNASRVWALGFRNPFRMTRRSNGELYVSDVGEDDFEELNRVVKGGNFGWPCYEGNSPGIGAAVNPYCPISTRLRRVSRPALFLRACPRWSGRGRGLL